MKNVFEEIVTLEGVRDSVIDNFMVENGARPNGCKKFTNAIYYSNSKAVIEIKELYNILSENELLKNEIELMQR